MPRSTPGQAFTMRLSDRAGFTATTELATAAAASRAEITALDVIESTHQNLSVDITCNSADDEHAQQVAACLDTKDTKEILAIVKAIATVYGGINLEDTSAPRCFEIERRWGEELGIPVFYDDQHGTALVLAALINALSVGQGIESARVVVSEAGAAGHAIIQLLRAQWAGHIVGCDRSGTIHRGQRYADPHRQWIADNTNDEDPSGTLREVMVRADVFIGVCAPNIVAAEQVQPLPEGAIVLVLANPDPEIHPLDANQDATVVATGRSDFPKPDQQRARVPAPVPRLAGPRRAGHQHAARGRDPGRRGLRDADRAQRQLHRPQRPRPPRRTAVAEAVVATVPDRLSA